MSSSVEGDKSHQFERLVQNVVNKVAHVLVQSRLKDDDISSASSASSSSASSSSSPSSASSSKSPSTSKPEKENQWFNLITPDNQAIKAALAPWKRHPSYSASSASSSSSSSASASSSSMPPSFSSVAMSSVFTSTGSYPTLHVQFYLTLPNAPIRYRIKKDPAELKGQKLGASSPSPQEPETGYHQIEINHNHHNHDHNHNEAERLRTVVLEDWSLSFDHPLNSEVSISTAYLNGVVFIRSLYTFTRLFPAHKLRSKLYKSNSPFKLGYRILSSSTDYKRLPTEQPLNAPILGWSFDTTSEQALPGELQTLFGTFHVSVTYRNSCDFELLEKVGFNSVDSPFETPSFGIPREMREADPMLEGLERRSRSRTMPSLPSALPSSDHKPPLFPPKSGAEPPVKKSDEEHSRDLELQEPSFLDQQKPPSREARKFVEPHSLPKSLESTSPHYRHLGFTKERSNSKPKISPFKSLEGFDETRPSEHSSSSLGNSESLETPEAKQDRTNFLMLMLSNPQMKIYEDIQPKSVDPAQKQQPSSLTDDFLEQFRKVKDDFDMFSDDVNASCTLKEPKKEKQEPLAFKTPVPLLHQGSPLSKPVSSSLSQQLKSPPILGQTPPPPVSSSPSPSPQPTPSTQREVSTKPPVQGIPISTPKVPPPQVDELGLEESKPPQLSELGLFEDASIGSDGSGFGSSSEELFPIQDRGPRARRGDDLHPLGGLGSDF